MKTALLAALVVAALGAAPLLVGWLVLRLLVLD